MTETPDRERHCLIVEDEPTLALLRGIGVHYGQGFLLGEPAPIESLPGHCAPQDLVAAPALH